MNQGGTGRGWGGGGGGQGWGGGGGGHGWGGGGGRGWGGGQSQGQGRGGPGTGRGRNTQDCKHQPQIENKREGDDEKPPAQAKINEKWDKAAGPVEDKQDQDTPGEQNSQTEDNQGNNSQKTDEVPPNTSNNDNPAQNRTSCEICGFFNHLTKDCRRLQCEICGYNNHTTYDYKRCVLWNTGPELCVAQVEDQSFFFIEENIDPRISREKECIGVINIIQGHATAKQVEQQFMFLVGSNSWKWNARQVGENRFVRRFPTAKLLRDWGKVKAMAMNDVDAVMKVEPWTARIAAKGMLQQAWFRVGDIPADQRSIRTIAKVGGLVGKVVEIDEKTRFRANYVRVKIACRDIHKVPKTAESTLGIYLYDFTFEREVEEVNSVRTLTSGIKVGDKEPPNKKYKPEDQNRNGSQSGPARNNEPKPTEAGANKVMQHHQHGHVSSSSSPKGSGKLSEKAKGKTVVLEKEVVKSQNAIPQLSPQVVGADAPAEKVHVPDSFEDSDDESLTLSEKLRSIDAYTEVAQSSKQDDVEGDQQVWHMDVDENTKMDAQFVNSMLKSQSAAGKLSVDQLTTTDGRIQSQENFSQDENVNVLGSQFNSQESVLTDDGKERDMELADKMCADGGVKGGEEADKTVAVDLPQDGGFHKMVQPERRQSERLKKDVLLSTMERNEAMAKKRSLEGNSKKNPTNLQTLRILIYMIQLRAWVW